MSNRLALILVASAAMLLVSLGAPAYVSAGGLPPEGAMEGDRWTDTDDGVVKEYDGIH